MEKNVQRSEIMSKIRKVNTKPELIVRKFLFKHGFRYRINVKSLPGNPDIVLPKYRTIIMVNGCFWHAHEGCKLNRMPKSRPEYWIPKIEGNVKRDVINLKRLQELYWKVLVVWECQLKKPTQELVLKKLMEDVKS